MSHATQREQSALIILAVALFVSAMACGQLLAGCAGMAIVLAGMASRRQPACRKAGNALIIAGFLCVLVAMLFGTGYQLGKDMAHRDNMQTAAHSRSR